MKTARQIWKDCTIEERTCDEFGREGRGVPLRYYNCDNKYNGVLFFELNDLIQSMILTDIPLETMIVILDFLGVKYKTKPTHPNHLIENEKIINKYILEELI